MAISITNLSPTKNETDISVDSNIEIEITSTVFGNAYGRAVCKSTLSYLDESVTRLFGLKWHEPLYLC